MESKQIESNLLPELNGTTKDLINNGVWFLYALENSPVQDAKYCLVADKTYILNSRGSIINVSAELIQSLTYKERLMFSDLPKTIAQENVAVKWA